MLIGIAYLSGRDIIVFDEPTSGLDGFHMKIIADLFRYLAEKGKTIFISGGTGSVGAMAIPIAKAKGLTVITNGSADSRDRVLDLGAEKFLDYMTEDYTKVLKDIDYVLDTLRR